jgi:hypothetical protein
MKMGESLSARDELLLAMTVCRDRHVSLDELAEVVLEVDRLVGREELEGG